jgi:hypothetical protein
VHTVRTDTAIQLIDNLVYKPGWIFEARDNSKRFQDSICLTVTYPAMNSDREEAAAGFPTPIPPNGARASFNIPIHDADDMKLYRHVVQVIMWIEEHEAREFLRVKPSYWAPFHPHNSGGIENWANAIGRSVELVRQADFTFGLV